MLLNIQGSLQAQPNSFEQRFLYHAAIEAVLPKARHRSKLYRAFRDRVIEVKADQFGAAIENAKTDHLDSELSALVVQYFVDELYGFCGLTDRPTVVAQREGEPAPYTMHFNVNFGDLGHLTGTNLNVHPGTPLSGSIHANRWSLAAVDTPRSWAWKVSGAREWACSSVFHVHAHRWRGWGSPAQWSTSGLRWPRHDSAG